MVTQYPLTERKPSLVLVARNTGDVHIYRHRRWSATISAAGGLQALEFVQCFIEAALDRSLVAGELGKSIRVVSVADEGPPQRGGFRFRFASNSRALEMASWCFSWSVIVVVRGKGSGKRSSYPPSCFV